MLLHTVTITAYIAVVVVAGDPTPPGHWEVRWQDDFDGNSLDKSKWTTWSSSYSDNCRGNKKDHKLEYNLPENLQVENGVLKIIARRQQHHASPGETYSWTSGLITTGDSCGHEPPSHGVKVHKGDYIQVRAKLPHEIGMWPAFWTWNNGDNEIDVFEYHPNNPKILELSNHTPGGGSKYVDVKEAIVGKWHYFGAYLGHDKVEWYFDGKMIWTDHHGFNSDGAYLIVDMAVVDGHYHPAPPKGVDVSTMYVDSVKVFSLNK